MEGNKCQNYSKRRRTHLFRQDIQLDILNLKKEETLIYTICNNLITFFDGSLDEKSIS